MKRIAYALPILAFAACGGGSSMSQQDAALAYSAALTVAGNALSAASSCTTCLSNGQALTIASLEVDCPNGGTVSVTGETDALGTDWDLDLTYNMCQSDGFTIDGMLNYSGTTTQTQSNFSMDGQLEFSGEAEGSCKMSVESSTNLETQQFTLSANICGQKVSGSY